MSVVDPLLELLGPHLRPTLARTLTSPTHDSTTITAYSTRLTGLSLASLTSEEPQSLSQALHQNALALQKLSTKSHNAVIKSSDDLSTLRASLPALADEAHQLRNAVPSLDQETLHFAQSFNKTAENAVLDRRKKVLLLSRNADRLSDILDLPSLLESTISSANVAPTQEAPVSSSSGSNYSFALDLYAHIKRLHTLYPHSPLVKTVASQADDAIQQMTVQLISTLKAPGLRLAAAMRTIGWLRRVAPELERAPEGFSAGTSEGGLGALFLTCRLANLESLLEALIPLRELADQETETRLEDKEGEAAAAHSQAESWSNGQQTERYLKRYIETFREQSFAVISMYRSIFPAADHSESNMVHGVSGEGTCAAGVLQPQPSASSIIPVHLVNMLVDTLREYLPNVRDRGSRESLLTQLLYCAGSLGRLGADFSMVLAPVGGPGVGSPEGSKGRPEEEWVSVVRKHRSMAGRLELLASGVGTSHPGSDISELKRSALAV